MLCWLLCHTQSEKIIRMLKNMNGKRRKGNDTTLPFLEMSLASTSFSLRTASSSISSPCLFDSMLSWPLEDTARVWRGCSSTESPTDCPSSTKCVGLEKQSLLERATSSTNTEIPVFMPAAHTVRTCHLQPISVVAH